MLIGDCTLATSYMPTHHRNEVLLAARLRALYPHDALHITNEGLDGEHVGGFLARYERTFARHAPPDYVLVRYGINDRRTYGTEGFASRLHTLLDRLQADFPRVRIVLETGVFVDFPAHYEFDRNAVLQPIYQVIRDVGRARGFPVVDVYARMAHETALGNWDLRVRGYGVVEETIPVLGVGQDHVYGDDVRWFTNIHPNPKGMAVFVDEQVRVLQQHWPETLRVQA